MLCLTPPTLLEEKAELEKFPSTHEVQTRLHPVIECCDSGVTVVGSQLGPALGTSQDDASSLSQRVSAIHNFH